MSGLSTLGAVAGVAGIALGVFLILNRELIRKNIFPSLGKKDAYQIIRLIVILTFSIAALSIAAWVITQWQKKDDKGSHTTPEPLKVSMTEIRAEAAPVPEDQKAAEYKRGVRVNFVLEKTGPITTCLFELMNEVGTLFQSDRWDITKVGYAHEAVRMIVPMPEHELRPKYEIRLLCKGGSTPWQEVTLRGNVTK